MGLLVFRRSLRLMVLVDLNEKTPGMQVSVSTRPHEKKKHTPSAHIEKRGELPAMAQVLGMCSSTGGKLGSHASVIMNAVLFMPS